MRSSMGAAIRRGAAQRIVNMTRPREINFVCLIAFLRCKAWLALGALIELLDKSLLNKSIHDAVVEQRNFRRPFLTDHLQYGIHRSRLDTRNGVQVLHHEF